MSRLFEDIIVRSVRDTAGRAITPPLARVVYDLTLDGTVATQALTGLDVNAALGYRLYIIGRHAIVASSSVWVYVNADLTAGNYASQGVRGVGVAVTGGTSVGPFVGQSDQNKPFFYEISFPVVANSAPLYTAQSNSFVTSAAVFSQAIYYNQVAANITSITIQLANGAVGSFTAGTRILLLKNLW